MLGISPLQVFPSLQPYHWPNGHGGSWHCAGGCCHLKSTSEVSDTLVRREPQMARKEEQKEQQLVVLKLMVQHKIKHCLYADFTYLGITIMNFSLKYRQALLLDSLVLALEDFCTIFSFPCEEIVSQTEDIVVFFFFFLIFTLETACEQAGADKALGNPCILSDAGLLSQLDRFRSSFSFFHPSRELRSHFIASVH